MYSLCGPITKLLLKSVKYSDDIYNIELEEQGKLELKLKVEQNKVKKLQPKRLKMRKKSIINEIAQEITIKNSIIVANESVDDGDKELQKCLLQKTLCKNGLQKAQSIWG